MTRDPDLENTPAKRGRPKTPDPLSPVTVWVPTAMHDRLIQRAAQTGDSVSATTRDLLARTLKS